MEAILTDPPYELGIGGLQWDKTGIAYNERLWASALRVLKPGGWLAAFSSTRTYHRMASAVEDAGFVVQDMIAFMYGTGRPSGAARLRPAHEPVLLASKGHAVLQIQRAGIPAEESRPVFQRGAPQTSKIFGSGYYATQRASGFTNLPRWPTNAALHHEIDCQDPSCPVEHLGPAAKLFYTSKASPAERKGNPHPTPKPLSIMEWLVNLTTVPGDTVLDPFMGSGTTGVAATKLGRDFIGCELDKAFAETARRRINAPRP